MCVPPVERTPGTLPGYRSKYRLLPAYFVHRVLIIPSGRIKCAYFLTLDDLPVTAGLEHLVRFLYFYYCYCYYDDGDDDYLEKCRGRDYGGVAST